MTASKTKINYNPQWHKMTLCKTIVVERGLEETQCEQQVAKAEGIYRRLSTKFMWCWPGQ